MEDFVLYAKSLLSRNTNDAIEFLENIIDKDSSLFSDFILQSRRYYDNQKLFHQGRVSYDEYCIAQNQANFGLLKLIEEIQKDNLFEEGKAKSAFQKKKQDREERIIKNQILRIDDNQERLKKRNILKELIIGTVSFLGIILVLWVVLTDNETMLEWEIYVFLLIFVLAMLVMLRTIGSYYRNDGQLSRKKQNLKILVNGHYNEVFDSLFHSLVEIRSKVKSYDRNKGMIKANILTVAYIERIFAVWGGEYLEISLKKKEDNMIEIDATSTTRNTLGSAHEADFFKLHERINRKNLSKLQKSIIKNLSS